MKRRPVRDGFVGEWFENTESNHHAAEQIWELKYWLTYVSTLSLCGISKIAISYSFVELDNKINVIHTPMPLSHPHTHSQSHYLHSFLKAH